MYPQSTFLSKNKKNVNNVLQKIFNFHSLRKICVLYGRVFVKKKKVIRGHFIRGHFIIYEPRQASSLLLRL